MKSNLVDGKLIPPSSPLSAQIRQQQLAYEITKVEEKIHERRHEIGKLYLAWNERTVGALGWMRSEEKQLSAWMLENGVEPKPPRVKKVTSPVQTIRAMGVSESRVEELAAMQVLDYCGKCPANTCQGHESPPATKTMDEEIAEFWRE